MEGSGLEEALWRVLQQRKGGVGGGGFDGGQEDDGEYIEYHLYLDDVERSADPGRWAAQTLNPNMPGRIVRDLR